jgi:RNA polymerase sigma-70 factor, ECF subfamily
LYAELNTEALMSAYVGGDPHAFDELYRRVSPRLFGYLMQLTRNRERAEDLLQVTFSKVHRARASYLPEAPVLPWLMAIARRTFYDEARAMRARREDLSREGELPEPPLPAEEPPHELTGSLDAALGDLPEAYREAIQLTRLSGLSMAEAATVSGTTVAAMKLRVHRGYKALREALEEARRDLLR